MENIILGGGCFWCTEAVFLELEGVEKVESGYSGGRSRNPTYREICTGLSGHAEVVRVSFDPEKVDLATILAVFFTTHDPTTLNRQGADSGTQYRSVIFFKNESEKQAAETAKAAAQAIWPDPIVTEISPLTEFFIAEDYHQDYYHKNPGQGYCAFVINPKMAKFRKDWGAKLKG